jgi:DNA-binding response OmpR family regulator
MNPNPQKTKIMQVETLYKQPLVFIADDDADDVFFVRSAIEQLKADIRIRHFSNGKQLIDSLNDPTDERPDLVLLDLNMPILDGKETLRILRKNDTLNEMPIIMLSTSTHSFERELCLGYGATNYITKPYSFSLYLQIFRRLKREVLDVAMAS